jgi:branched-chain amino acid transport system permease protein
MNKKLKSTAVVLLLVLLFAAPYIGLPVHVQSLLYVIFYWITLATSWNILSGYSGYFSFGHGAFFGVGMYGMATLATKADWPVVPAALGSGVLAALLALAVGALVFNARKIRGESFALITLALGFVLATIVVNTPLDGGPGVYLMSVSLPQWGPKPASTFYYASLVLAVVCVGVARWIFHAKAGLGLLAIHDDEDSAEVNGVPALRLKMAAFALSSFFAGVMGAVHALYVSYVTVGETFNITVPLTVVLMSILGGSRHWLGPMVGAVLITLLLNAFTAGDSALVGRIIIGLVLAGAVLVMPRGIVGTWQLRQHKRQMQWKRQTEHESPVHATPEVEPISRQDVAAETTSVREKVLEVRGLSKHFSGIRALQQVDLDLYKGEILGLLGPNGSGKSTFINVVTGHYQPTEGAVLLAGQSCAGWPAHRIRRQGLSRTYQIPRPFHGLTVLQNVTLAAQYGGANLTDAQALQEAHEWMRFTGLEEKADCFPDEINLHQRKFLELARALAARPKVLLLDEVLSGLTPSEINSAVQTIRLIRDRGTSIVFVEHVMSAVLALSDRLVVLNQGQVIAEGLPQDVMSRPEVVSAYLGDGISEHAPN